MHMFGFLILVRDFIVILCFDCCWIPLPLRSLMWLRGLRFWRKLGFLFGWSCLARLTLLIGLLGGLHLSGLLVVCCVEWRRKILITFSEIAILQGLYGAPFFMSSVLALPAQGVLEWQLRSSFLHSLFGDEGGFLCTIICDIWSERNDTVFRGRERGIVRFVLCLDFKCLFGLWLQRTFVAIL